MGEAQACFDQLAAEKQKEGDRTKARESLQQAIEFEDRDLLMEALKEGQRAQMSEEELREAQDLLARIQSEDDGMKAGQYLKQAVISRTWETCKFRIHYDKCKTYFDVYNAPEAQEKLRDLDHLNRALIEGRRAQLPAETLEEAQAFFDQLPGRRCEVVL